MSRIHAYALALGGNRPTRHGSPARTLAAAADAIAAAGIGVTTRAPTFATPAMGPAGRGFANGAILVTTPLDPPALLAVLKRIERDFGRRPGRRWGSRPLDIDILLWSGGRWPRAHARPAPGALAIPHAALAGRRFVLDPLVRIAPRWILPGTTRTIRHLHARATG